MVIVPIAVRGSRLALTRRSYRDIDDPDQPITVDTLSVIEVGADGLMDHSVTFDPDDFDAAFAELEAHYLAGEAATHAHTWSLVAGAYAAFNRREVAPTTPDWVNIDHRRGAAFAPGDMIRYQQAAWDDSPDTWIHIAVVHRLSAIGAVVTHGARGISQKGFDAEWRDINVLTVNGDLISHSELFDEADLDAALARFEELSRSRPALENAATRNWSRLADAFNRRDGNAILALASEDGRYDERRNGLHHVLEGPARRKVVEATLETALSTWRLEIEPIAVRGSRLSLTRGCYRDTGAADRPIAAEMLHVMEVDADGLMQHTVTFDPDDIDAAYEELDARYLAGEAAVYAPTWSVIAEGYRALNRHEIPQLAVDFVSLDHRRGIAFAPGEMVPYMWATFAVASDIRINIDVVHRLSALGMVFTHAAYGTSQDGFTAEWRETALLTVSGGLVNRCEMFDETDVQAALARFEELHSAASS